VRGTPPAQPSNLETHDLYCKIILCRDLPFQPLECGAVKLLDFPTTKTGKMQMVFLRLDLVIMLFSVEVHQVQLIDQPQALEQLQGPVYGRAIDIGVPLAGARQERSCIKVGVRALDGFDQRTPLCGQPNPPRLNLIQQLAAFQRHFSSCDSFALGIIYDNIGPITTPG
jgi:hypothetical protein